jgi:hypothetical protein
VTALGLRYSLVTRFTSFVAVDEARVGERGGAEETYPVGSGGDPISGDGGSAVMSSGFVTGSGSGGMGFSGGGIGGGGSSAGQISGAGRTDTGGGVGKLGVKGKTAKSPKVLVVMKLWSSPGRAAHASMTAIVRRRLGAMRACLGNLGTALAGTLSWNLVVAADGSISRVGRAHGPFEERSAACVERTLARLAFGSGEGLRRLRLDLVVTVGR